MSELDPGVESRLRERVVETLPDDRQLVPEEADPVAGGVDADAVSAVRYADSDGFEAVPILILWWERHEAMAIADRYVGETWTVKFRGDVDLDTFEQVVDSAGEMQGADRVGPDRLRMDDGSIRELDRES